MRRKLKAERDAEYRFPNQKVTADQRAELINLWLAGDMAAVFKMQRELGVDYKYTQRRAHVLGLTKDKITRDNADPRWEWAISRGPVVA